MSDTLLIWLPGMVVLLVGVSVGLYFAAVMRREPPPGADVEGDLEDLDSRRENLIALLRDLESQRDILDPTTYGAQKAELEARAVEVTHARDRRLAQEVKDGGPRPAPTAAVRFLAERPQLQGLLWGAGAVLVLGGIFLAVKGSGDAARGSATAATGSAASERPLSPEAQREIDGLLARLQQNPTDIQAFVRGGQVMLEEMRISDARTFIERALQLDPEEPQALLAYATVLATQGDTAGAFIKLDQVLKKSPDMLEALYLSGVIATQNGDEARKKASLERFIAKAPDGPQKKEAQALLAGKGLDAVAPKSGVQGAALWASRCALCHGENGRGDTPMGRGMGLPDMTASDWQAKTPDDAIRRVIREGVNREKDGRKERMQASPTLSAAELDDLVRVIRSFAGNPH